MDRYNFGMFLLFSFAQPPPSPKRICSQSFLYIDTDIWEPVHSNNPPSPRYSLGPIVPYGTSVEFLIFDGREALAFLSNIAVITLLSLLQQDMRIRCRNAQRSLMKCGVGYVHTLQSFVYSLPPQPSPLTLFHFLYPLFML